MNKFLPKTSNSPKGFTLVELLVVISIIAILAVVGMTIFSGVQSRARDSRRQSDVSAIAKALEAQKTAGAAGYNQIKSTWFAGNVVPTESADYASKYSILYTTAVGAPIAKPTAWGAVGNLVANPSLPAGAPTGAAVATVADSIPASGTIYTFQVCALLENYTTFPNIFCVPSAQ